MRAELRAATKRPVFFIEAEFKTALVRFWTGGGKVTWRGAEWSGPTGAKSGSILSMEPIVEASATEATGLKFVLSGVSVDLLGYCLDEISKAKACRVWLGAVNDAGALVDEPIPVFEGWMDASNIAEVAEQGGLTGRITLTVESDLRRLQIANARTWTHEDQQIDFSGDTGLKNISAAAHWKGMWGSRQVGSASAGVGSSASGGDLARLVED
mgnify:FL=1